MRKIFLLGLLVTFFLVGSMTAQRDATKHATKIVRLEVDGKEVRNDFKVFFLLRGNWIEAKRKMTGFFIPYELEKEEYLAVSIEFGKYKLEFSRLHISNFGEDWVVGVDKKPFSDEYVKPEEKETTKLAYYLRFEGSEPARQIIVTERKS